VSQSNRNYLKSILKALWSEMDAARADGDFDTVHFLQKKEQRIEALLVA
jgi:hypothetical protein